MKKLLIVLSIMMVIIHAMPQKIDFSLLDFFSGEYYVYTENQISDASINLGFCYMTNSNTNQQKLGESIVVNNLEIGTALNALNAKVIKTEVLDDGTVVIYGKTNKINKNVNLDNQQVNLQLAQKGETTVIGWPLIMGSF